jgi:hypothetical protein
LTDFILKNPCIKFNKICSAKVELLHDDEWFMSIRNLGKIEKIIFVLKSFNSETNNLVTSNAIYLQQSQEEYHAK